MLYRADMDGRGLGAATVNGKRLTAGDAVAVEDEPAVEVTGEQTGEVLLFDLA